jgi:hypothetical protein
MLAKPPITVLQSLASLGGNSDFEVVCSWLEESLGQIRSTNDATRDEVQSRWNQGASQALAEFLEKKQSARDILRKLK